MSVAAIEWKQDGRDHKARGRFGEDEWSVHWDALVEKEWSGSWEAVVFLYEDAIAMDRDNEFDEIVVRGLPSSAEAKRHIETVVRVFRERHIAVTPGEEEA